MKTQKQNPSDKLEHWPIDKLIPYARNSRTHSDAQVAQIAASIREWGWTTPVLVDSGGTIIAGHGRVMAARKLGIDKIPVVIADGWTDAQKRAYVIADNKLALNAGWDADLLGQEFAELADVGFDLDLTGFTAEEIDALKPVEVTAGLTDEDAVPEARAEPVTKPGDVWVLGKHRLMCGDSTSITDVERLMNGKKAKLLHADPPYGMGKAADGVANDNIYEEDLDRFQMEWWATFRTFLDDNASAYIWGNAADLWRLWYRGGLADSERLEIRNEIVWDKSGDPNPTARVNGLPFEGMTAYFSTERCLFFQFGNQFLGSVNADDFPETWEPLRSYMESQAKAAGIKSKDIERICKCQMFGHWFTRSQFTLMPEKHYKTLADEYPGHFQRPWKDLKREWDTVKGGPTSEVQSARSYFDNTHDGMTDVWKFLRVTGDDRHGHATPKPVQMMERVMKSSLPKGGLCVEPFGGSGSTLMGAEKTGRVCYLMELQAKYCDVIVKRWQDFTGKQAVLEATGKPFAEVASV